MNVLLVLDSRSAKISRTQLFIQINKNNNNLLYNKVEQYLKHSKNLYYYNNNKIILTFFLWIAGLCIEYVMFIL